MKHINTSNNNRITPHDPHDQLSLQNKEESTWEEAGSCQKTMHETPTSKDQCPLVQLWLNTFMVAS